MTRNTANVSFYCRESKKNKDGTAPIEMSLVINGKRCYVQLPRKEVPADFSKALASKKGCDLKDYLAAVRGRLHEIETAFIRDGQALTAEGLRAYFKTGGYVLYTVGDLFSDYLRILAKRVGKDLTPKTYRKYEIARDKFFKILPPSEPVAAITKAVIMDYQASMNRYLDYVTTNGYCQRVKTIVQFGINKPIFSHVARHTYATRCLNRGIRLEVVAKLLGHSTTRITQHYAKLLKNNIINELKDAFEKSY